MKNCLVILVILVLFLSGCKPDLSDGNIKKDPAGAMNTCAGAPDKEQDGCYMRISEVLRTTNPDTSFQACSNIKDNNMKGGCYQELLKAQTDPTVRLNICTKVDLSDMKKGCIEELVREENDAKKAAALCGEIKDDPNFKEHCLNLISGASQDVDTKLALCDAREDKDRCYQDVGTSLFLTQPEKGVEVCNKIKDQVIRDNCLNNFMFSPELIKANPTLSIQVCDAMTLKDGCYNNVADKLSATDPKTAAGVCKKLSDEVQTFNCFNMVWFSFSATVKDNYDFSISLCNSLSLKKDDCFRRVAEAFMSTDKSKAQAACKMISDQSSSTGCLNQIK